MARWLSPHLPRDRGAFDGESEDAQTRMLTSSGPGQTDLHQFLVRLQNACATKDSNHGAQTKRFCICWPSESHKIIYAYCWCSVILAKEGRAFIINIV